MAIPQFDWIAHHAAYGPDRLAQEDLHSGRRFSYREMDRRVTALATFFQKELGVRAGDRIASLCYNSTDVFEMMFAAQRIGAIHLLLNWRLATPELEFILKDAEPRVLVYSEEFAGPAEELKRACALPHLLLKRDGVDSPFEQAAGAPGRPVIEPRSLDDTWMLLYTSGTTGRPKGAQITYRAHLFNAMNTTMAVELTRHSRTLLFLPQFHVGGMCVYAVPGFHLGASTAVMRQFDPAQCLALLGDPASGITHTFGVPTNFLIMSQLPEFQTVRLDHLVHVGIGGAPAPLSVLRAFADRGLRMQQAWGMTETCSLGTVLSKERALDKIGSSGQKVMHTELRIIDADGRDLPPGEKGELLIKGPTVTPGYWRRPEANATVLADGWLRTGDAAYVDEEGFYFIVDRWKDMYISGGENVYPAEVEEVIYKLAEVAEVAVIGVADPRWGEVGRAFVALKPGAVLGEADVIEHCRRNLARFKVPQSVRFVDDLPHNATGKVTKHALPRD
jgi:fatty-acyl-CoA synthase